MSSNLRGFLGIGGECVLGGKWLGVRVKLVFFSGIYNFFLYKVFYD